MDTMSGGTKAAAASRIERLVKSMHKKIEAMQEEKDRLRQQVEELTTATLYSAEAQRLQAVLKEKSQKMETIATKMREETKRMRQKEVELGRREAQVLLLEQQQWQQGILTERGVRLLYSRLQEIGGGVATRGALLQALRNDSDIRGLFQNEEDTSATLERLLESETPMEAPKHEDTVITWEEFRTTVLGPPRTPESRISTVSENDPSPPPPRQPDLSPMAVYGPPQAARDPSPPIKRCFARSSRCEPPPERSQAPSADVKNEETLDIDAIDHSEELAIRSVDAIEHSEETAADTCAPFVDLSFLPNTTSAPQGAYWSRARLSPPPNQPPKSIAAVSGICSNRTFLSLLCLVADPVKLFSQPREWSDYGATTVRLACTDIAVDNLFPSVEGCPVHASAGPFNMWLMLVEKALAKLKGSYGALELSKDDPADLLTMLCPAFSLVSFPCTSDSLDEFFQSSSASHLQLLCPRPTAVSRLADIGSLYTVQDLWPRPEACQEEGQVEDVLCLVWCPVVSQGGLGVDAKWIPLAEISTLFSHWSLVDCGSVFLPRRDTAVDLPPPPAEEGINFQEHHSSRSTRSPPSISPTGAAFSAQPLPACNGSQATCSPPSISGLDTIGSESKEGCTDDPYSPTFPSSSPQQNLPKQSSEQRAEDWQQAMLAVVQNNTAVVKEVQAHRLEAATAWRERDQAIKEVTELKEKLEAVEKQLQSSAQVEQLQVEAMTMRSERDAALCQISTLQSELDDLRQAKLHMEREQETTNALQQEIASLEQQLNVERNNKQKLLETTMTLQSLQQQNTELERELQDYLNEESPAYVDSKSILHAVQHLKQSHKDLQKELSKVNGDQQLIAVLQELKHAAGESSPESTQSPPSETCSPPIRFPQLTPERNVKYSTKRVQSVSLPSSSSCHLQDKPSRDSLEHTDSSSSTHYDVLEVHDGVSNRIKAAGVIGRHEEDTSARELNPRNSEQNGELQLKGVLETEPTEIIAVHDNSTDPSNPVLLTHDGTQKWVPAVCLHNTVKYTLTTTETGLEVLYAGGRNWVDEALLCNSMPCCRVIDEDNQQVLIRSGVRWVPEDWFQQRISEVSPILTQTDDGRRVVVFEERRWMDGETLLLTEQKLSSATQNLMCEMQELQEKLLRAEDDLVAEKEGRNLCKERIKLLSAELQLQREANQSTTADLEAHKQSLQGQLDTSAELLSAEARAIDAEQELQITLTQLELQKEEHLSAMNELRTRLETELPRLQQELAVQKQKQGISVSTSTSPITTTSTATTCSGLSDELHQAHRRIEKLEQQAQEDQKARAALDRQVNQARYELAELLKEVEMRRRKESENKACPESLCAEVVQLKEENKRLAQGESEQLAVACDEMNRLQAEAQAAVERAVTMEEKLNGIHQSLQMQEEVIADLQRQLEHYKKLQQTHEEEIQIREVRLQSFADDTAVLQAKIKDALAFASANNEAEVAALKRKLKECQESNRLANLKLKRSAKALQEKVVEHEAQVVDLERAMNVAAKEIQALHTAREELKKSSENRVAQFSQQLEEHAEENRHLRMEIVKVMSERNLLQQQGIRSSSEVSSVHAVPNLPRLM